LDLRGCFRAGGEKGKETGKGWKGGVGKGGNGMGKMGRGWIEEGG